MDEEDNGNYGEDDTWYLGAYPSWRANAAFSLYGSLKGEGDQGCKDKTFINSFHTTEGIESFTNAVAAAGLTNLFNVQNDEQQQQDDATNDEYVTSTCYQNEDGGQNNGDDNIATGDKYDKNAVSYGVGCTADKDFAIFTYSGGVCDANAILEMQDDLSDFNGRLDKAICVPIYKQGDSYNSNNGQGGGGGENNDNSSPLAILESSKACHLYDGLGSCPDPYGILKRYQKKLIRATGAMEVGPWWTPRRVMITAWTMISSGAFLALVGFILVIKECCSPSTSDGETPGKGKSLSRDRSEVSAAPSLASRISRSISESFTGTSSRHSKRSSRSKSSRRSGKSRSNSRKSLKSTRSNRSNRSTRSSHADKEIEVNKTESYRSQDSNLSDPDEEEATNEEESVASQGAKTFSDIVDFVKTRTNEFFEDENDDDSVERKIPDKLPKASPRRHTPEETEASTFTEEPTKKWRKRRWFQKLLGGGKK